MTRPGGQALCELSDVAHTPPAPLPLLTGSDMAAAGTDYFLRGVLIPDETSDGGYGYRTVDVTLSGGLIAALVPSGEGAAPPGAVVVDCADKLLLPGSVNAHTHTSEHWARGLIKPLPLELWIHQLVRRAPRAPSRRAGAGAGGRAAAAALRFDPCDNTRAPRRLRRRCATSRAAWRAASCWGTRTRSWSARRSSWVRPTLRFRPSRRRPHALLRHESHARASPRAA